MDLAWFTYSLLSEGGQDTDLRIYQGCPCQRKINSAIEFLQEGMYAGQPYAINIDYKGYFLT